MTESQAPPPSLPDGSSPLGALDQARALLITAGVLLALVGAAQATLQPPWMPSNAWLSLSFAFGASLPFFVTAVALRGEPSNVALGAASALSWVVITILVVTPAIALIGVASVLAGSRSSAVLGIALGGVVGLSTIYRSMPRIGYVLLLALCIVCFVLLKRLRRVARGSSTGFGSRAAGGLGVLLYCAALGFFMHRAETAVMTANTIDVQEQALRMGSPADSARKSMRRMQTCLLAYERAHERRGFPASLVSVGPLGVACLDSSLATGSAGQWQVRYVPNAPDPAGRAGGYWLVAEPKEYGQTDIFYADESGAIYEMYDRARGDSLINHRNVPVSSVPPAADSWLRLDDSPVYALLETRKCLLERGADSAVHLPPALFQGRCHDYPLHLAGPNVTVGVSSYSNRGPLPNTYRVSYTPRRSPTDARFVDFTLAARPAKYGVDGIRSFLVDEAGVVHWTAEDRDATLEDPAVPPCERYSAGTVCRYSGRLATLDTLH